MKFRHEYKHQINLADIYGLRTRLSAVVKHDSHASDDGTYFIKSLYFDNYMDKALREKIDGVNKREKFRIRYYGTDTSFIKLEKKSKINGLCNKISCPITAEECQKIIDGDIEFMKDSEFELMRELYSKMKYQLLTVWIFPNLLFRKCNSCIIPFCLYSHNNFIAKQIDLCIG